MNFVKNSSLVILSALALTSCSKQPATFTPAIKSVVESGQVFKDALVWTQVDSLNRYYTVTSGTPSMEPFFTAKSIPLFVRYKGQKLENGMVLDYDRGDIKDVLHVMADQNETSVYMSGYNNHNSDGWFPKSSVKGIVVGQLYLP